MADTTVLHPRSSTPAPRPRASAGDNDEQSLATSLGKALALLDALGGEPPLGVSELARRVDLPKSTAFRLLAGLEESGFVDRVGSKYCLGRRLFELGNQISDCQPSGLRDVALPFLSALYERTHQTVHLAVLSGVDVLYLEKIYGHSPTKSPSHVGRRVPAACSGLGKAMLAFSRPAVVKEVLAKGLQRRTPYTISVERLFLEELSEIRRRGVAFDREEVMLGLTCVAAPIMQGGCASAAISVTGPTSWFDPSTYARRVQDAATAISQNLTSA